MEILGCFFFEDNDYVQFRIFNGNLLRPKCVEKTVQNLERFLNAISTFKRYADVLASFAVFRLACRLLLFHFNFEAK